MVNTILQISVSFIWIMDTLSIAVKHQFKFGLTQRRSKLNFECTVQKPTIAMHWRFTTSYDEQELVAMHYVSLVHSVLSHNGRGKTASKVQVTWFSSSKYEHRRALSSTMLVIASSNAVSRRCKHMFFVLS
jgi:hypothetical protein